MSTQALKNKYPHLHNWLLQDGQIELGYGQYDHVFIRITDAGGTFWESGNTIYNSLKDALTAANTAIAAWCDEIGLEMIEAWPKYSKLMIKKGFL